MEILIVIAVVAAFVIGFILLRNWAQSINRKANHLFQFQPITFWRVVLGSTPTLFILLAAVIDDHMRGNTNLIFALLSSGLLYLGLYAFFVRKMNRGMARNAILALLVVCLVFSLVVAIWYFWYLSKRDDYDELMHERMGLF